MGTETIDPAAEQREKELNDLREYQAICFRATAELAAEMQKPLKVDKQGRIIQGVFFLPPLIEPEGGFPPLKRKRTMPNQKCVCPVCQKSHMRKV